MREADERVARIELRFDRNEILVNARSDQMLTRFELLIKIVTTNHESTMNAMDLNRRLEKVELTITPKTERLPQST
jgi:hypothetical protein